MLWVRREEGGLDGGRYISGDGVRGKMRTKSFIGRNKVSVLLDLKCSRKAIFGNYQSSGFYFR